MFSLALLALAGCEAVGGGAGATVQLDSAEVTLAPGAELHDVRIGGRGASDAVDPASVTAEPGDAVRFVVGDGRTHALAFIVDSLAVDARSFLERTGQLRGPPLVNEGAAWVVLLEDAPPGRYPFYCRSHDAGGAVVVRPGD